jgi:hypothetical protein
VSAEDFVFELLKLAIRIAPDVLSPILRRGADDSLLSRRVLAMLPEESASRAASRMGEP